ncbi:NifB/NifX family molybdenum-iron cluster-binding protein [Propionicimonas sp.]|uniref:NifB/NifX family molybdenum-iron cluster-binding protein n=1 Tax=Propionicimonas sp. TaxID=1955623 RepID=UPI0017E9A24A|nr:NifB/NifX family molybdenum-iron cluster-binding protein [Propionicimonas sp.]MBU3976083.1 NifB/NifX family molybdenum-iron cluster-binding protein [Actinomycetota bacterium]MBA3020896.1 dinitrogenase iron-molybdenum cofactor biosynthesis protein [Propionicimonas sp.]MBU3985273.1 NifB/NifX family molybdenum-iron cluster-binding protein [Actinomycetota bacterium]MBU4008263.1 NifB/NifX family molybdenum-iron cluster-binding protein [Actinomycetota bacterium]MBU4064523.1 NifB/NifX family molyb
MRIAVTAMTDEGLAAPVAQHFGHAPYFVVLDVDAAEVSSVESLANPFLEGHQPGQIPQFISEQRAEVMLSGGMGGRAIQFFEQFGIAAATGAAGTVAQAVTDYLDGRVLGAKPCADSEAHGHG